MRRLTACVLVLLAIAVPREARAAPSRITCVDVESPGGQTIGNCAGGGSAVVPGEGGGTEPPRRRPIELVTALSSTPEAGRCTILATPTSAPGARAVAFEQALHRINGVFDPVLRQGLLNELWARVLAWHPGCPGTTPTEVAFGFVREIVPPGPDPRIVPGFALTGKPAFLETRAGVTAPARIATPLGLLDVTLRATGFAVDWGDGSAADRGPFAAPGRPWPHGEARHTYTHTGRYDVVVTQTWDAEWRLAGQSGRVDGLTSVGRLDGFEAQQLQAVRNR